MTTPAGKTIAVLVFLLGLASLALAVLLLLCFSPAGAQIVAPQACDDNVKCLRERVKDLRDYREFIEDQLALAKALNADLQSQLAACRVPAPELPPRTPKPPE